PKGNIISGATYLTAPQMRVFLASALNNFKVLEGQLDTRATAAKSVVQKNVLLDQNQAIQTVVEQAKNSFDPKFGGFGVEPKFPMPELLNFLIYWYSETGDALIKEMLKKTLSEMNKGGLFDHVEGGFFRYSTARDWSIPHFEKMLEDNALLISVYLTAYAIFGEKEFLECAKSALNYANTALFDAKEKYFFGTQNADEKYYQLPVGERKKLVAPAVDKTLYTDWNCMMSCALLKASAVLENEKLEMQALECIETIEKKCVKGKTVFHYFDSEPKNPYLLAGHAHLLRTYICAFNHTGKKKFLQKALQLFESIEEKFAAPQWGYFDTSHKEETGLLSEKHRFPKQNSLMAECLLKLGTITKKEKYFKEGRAIIQNIFFEALGNGVFAAPVAGAALLLEKGVLEAKLVWKTDAKQVLKKILSKDTGNTVVEFIETQEKNQPALMLCKKNVCFKTVLGLEQIGEI
ncbi:MAG: thioredoxin domain-containing protein, partial [Candidatus Diapherotrites archaeon]|nr:thioredoxin domain-containing protein [Candidatus Diapherotrites archaeon]